MATGTETTTVTLTNSAQAWLVPGGTAAVAQAPTPDGRVQICDGTTVIEIANEAMLELIEAHTKRLVLIIDESYSMCDVAISINGRRERVDMIGPQRTAVIQTMELAQEVKLLPGEASVFRFSSWVQPRVDMAEPADRSRFAAESPEKGGTNYIRVLEQVEDVISQSEQPITVVFSTDGAPGTPVPSNQIARLHEALRARPGSAFRPVFFTPNASRSHPPELVKLAFNAEVQTLTTGEQLEAMLKESIHHLAQNTTGLLTINDETHSVAFYTEGDRVKAALPVSPAGVTTAEVTFGDFEITLPVEYVDAATASKPETVFAMLASSALQNVASQIDSAIRSNEPAAIACIMETLEQVHDLMPRNTAPNDPLFRALQNAKDKMNAVVAKIATTKQPTGNATAIVRDQSFDFLLRLLDRVDFLATNAARAGGGRSRRAAKQTAAAVNSLLVRHADKTTALLTTARELITRMVASVADDNTVIDTEHEDPLTLMPPEGVATVLITGPSLDLRKLEELFAALGNNNETADQDVQMILRPFIDPACYRPIAIDGIMALSTFQELLRRDTALFNNVTTISVVLVPVRTPSEDAVQFVQAVAPIIPMQLTLGLTVPGRKRTGLAYAAAAYSFANDGKWEHALGVMPYFVTDMRQRNLLTIMRRSLEAMPLNAVVLSTGDAENDNLLTNAYTLVAIAHALTLCGPIWTGIDGFELDHRALLRAAAFETLRARVYFVLKDDVKKAKANVAQIADCIPARLEPRLERRPPQSTFLRRCCRTSWPSRGASAMWPR